MSVDSLAAVSLGKPQAEHVLRAERANADSGDHARVDAPGHRDHGAAAPQPPDGLGGALHDGVKASDSVKGFVGRLRWSRCDARSDRSGERTCPRWRA